MLSWEEGRRNTSDTVPCGCDAASPGSGSVFASVLALEARYRFTPLRIKDINKIVSQPWTSQTFTVHYFRFLLSIHKYHKMNHGDPLWSLSIPLLSRFPVRFPLLVGNLVFYSSGGASSSSFSSGSNNPSRSDESIIESISQSSDTVGISAKSRVGVGSTSRHHH